MEGQGGGSILVSVSALSGSSGSSVGGLPREEAQEAAGTPSAVRCV